MEGDKNRRGGEGRGERKEKERKREKKEGHKEKKEEGKKRYQTKRLLHSKRNNKIKRQPSKWGMIFANDSSDKIYKELIQLNTKQTILFKKKKKSRGPEQTPLPGRHTKGQQIHEKMFIFTSY